MTCADASREKLGKAQRDEKIKAKSTSCHVHFDEGATVHEISSRTALPIHDIWYQDADYEQMEMDNDAIVEIMIHEEGDGSMSSFSVESSITEYEESCYCTRGLENMRPGRFSQVDDTRDAQYKAVKKEQSYQRRKTKYDPESIANAYRTKSTHASKRIAHLRALLDESVARQIHNNSLLKALDDRICRNELLEMDGSRSKRPSTDSIQVPPDSSRTFSSLSSTSSSKYPSSLSTSSLASPPPARYAIAYVLTDKNGEDAVKELVGITKLTKKIVRESPTKCILDYSLKMPPQSGGKKKQTRLRR